MLWDFIVSRQIYLFNETAVCYLFVWSFRCSDRRVRAEEMFNTASTYSFSIDKHRSAMCTCFCRLLSSNQTTHPLIDGSENHLGHFVHCANKIPLFNYCSIIFFFVCSFLLSLCASSNSRPYWHRLLQDNIWVYTGIHIVVRGDLNRSIDQNGLGT